MVKILKVLIGVDVLIWFMVFGIKIVPWMNIVETMFLGVIQGVIVGIFLYFIFEKIIVKKPIVRLYIPPNPSIDNDKFQAKFYLHNSGNLTARNVVFTATFNNLEVLKIINGFDKNEEINGVQRILKEDVIHPYPLKPWPQNTRIGEIYFKIKDPNKDIRVNYVVAADAMGFFNDLYKINFKYEKGEKKD